MKISTTFTAAQEKRAKRRLLDASRVARRRVSVSEMQVQTSWFRSPHQVQLLNMHNFARALTAVSA
jgi:hypothetical protein